MGIVVCDVTPKGQFQKLALDLSPERQKETRPCTSRVVGVLAPMENSGSKSRGQGRWPEP